ncbi:MAG: hypothetical protein NZM28_03325 [Fimbriimonadales bacterium]|nr:hypothetical protein [Fimbriimonadales bacterium]
MERTKKVIRARARVLAGHRVEICDPLLPEGATVEVTVELPPPARKSLAQILRERPPSDAPEAVDSWEQYEQLLQQERDSWD